MGRDASLRSTDNTLTDAVAEHDFAHETESLRKVHRTAVIVYARRFVMRRVVKARTAASVRWMTGGYDVRNHHSNGRVQGIDVSCKCA